jgi:hypothetical protein
LDFFRSSFYALYQTGRHPEIPSMRARRLQRPNGGEGPFVLAGKHKVSQGYSPADLPILAKSGREWGSESAGLAHALRDDDL